MTTAVTARHRHAVHRPASSPSDFVGTLRVLRHYLRRDRIVAPLWILLLSVPVASVYVVSTDAVYPTAAGRASLAASIMASPAQRAMYGNVYNDSLGAVGVWKASVFHVLIAVAAILTVIRHTRADEETGRTELLDSTAIGRRAGLTAALLFGFGACALTGLIAVAGLSALDIPTSGSLAFSLSLVGSGMVFTAVAAVTAQLTTSARTARGLAFTALGAAYALRAVGDMRSATGSSVASWLSPLGWSLEVRPFAGERWWVLLLHLGATVALTFVAYRLLARRDVGAGMLPERPGPAGASAGLSSTLGLAWRTDRIAVALWTVGLCLYGLLIGSVTHGVGDEIGDSQIAHDMITRLGGTDALEHAFVAVAFGMLAMVASAFVISTILRLHQEETSGRAETVLAGAVDRTRWLATRIVMATAGSAVAMMLAGLTAGLTYGIAAGDVGATLPGVLGTAAVQLPSVWLAAAITVALFGLLPRFTPVAWGVLVGFVALYMLGSLPAFPQGLAGLQPYSHTPNVGVGMFDATPLWWLTAVDVALIVLGIMAFRRRDLR